MKKSHFFTVIFLALVLCAKTAMGGHKLCMYLDCIECISNGCFYGRKLFGLTYECMEKEEVNGDYSMLVTPVSPELCPSATINVGNNNADANTALEGLNTAAVWGIFIILLVFFFIKHSCCGCCRRRGDRGLPIAPAAAPQAIPYHEFMNAPRYQVFDDDDDGIVLFDYFGTYN